MGDLSKDFDNETDLHAAFDAEPDLAPVKPGPPPTLDVWNTLGFHVARHLTGGLGDKIIALEQAALDHGDKTHSFGERYNQNLAFNDRLLEDSDKVHPAGRWAGNAIGFGGNALALGAMAPARAAVAAPGTLAGLLQGAKAGGKLASLLGGVGGYAGSRSNSVLGTVANTGLGTLSGLLGGTLFGGLGGALAGKLAQRAAPQVVNAYTQAADELAAEGRPGLPMLAPEKPIPEALALQKYGVPLTLRQMNPEGTLAEISEASERIPLLGRKVQAQEKAPLNAWRDVAIRQAQPGEGPMVKGDVADKLGDVKRQIQGLYQSVEAAPAQIAAVHPKTGEVVNPVAAFKAILDDPGYQAGDTAKRAVHGVMKEELSKLYDATNGGKPITAGLLMDMRSALRSAADKARDDMMSGEPGARARAEMLQDAVGSISGGLKASLPKDALDTLATADGAWANLQRLVGASRSAARRINEGAFNPQDLSGELAKTYGPRFSTDSEAGGNLRELAKAGKVVFTPRDVKTGFGEVLKVPLGVSLGSMIYGANASPTAQAAMMAAAQRAAQTSARGMSEPAAGALENALTGYLQRVPAGTLPAEALNGLLSNIGGGGSR